MATSRTSTSPTSLTVAPPAPQPQRHFGRTSFLSLEHSARMIISVVLPLLVLGALSSSFSLWAGSNDATSSISSYLTGVVAQATAIANIGLGTALLVLAVLFWAFDRRVAGELVVRPQYQERLAYKLPIYGAFFVTAGLLISGLINLLSVLIGSLVLIGTNVDIGSLYLTNFLPTLLGLSVIGFAAWYQFKLLRGVGKGLIFSFVMGAVALVVSLMLIVTTAVTAHQSSTSSDDDRGSSSSREYDDLFDDFDYSR